MAATPPPDPKLRERRQEVVREHMESERRHEFAGTMATFSTIGAAVARELAGRPRATRPRTDA